MAAKIKGFLRWSFRIGHFWVILILMELIALLADLAAHFSPGSSPRLFTWWNYIFMLVGHMIVWSVNM